MSSKLPSVNGAREEKRGRRGFSAQNADQKRVRLRGITKLLAATYWPDYRYTGGCTESRFKKGPKGTRRGTQVDLQVREVVAASACKDLRGPRWNKLHPLTKKFLKALKILKLRPHDAQTAVADTAARLGTGVDLVCLDERGRHVLVEIKCGFGGYMDRGNGRMKAELSKFGNAPRWQHQAQLAVTWELFKRTFNVAPAKAFVVNPHEGGVTFHVLEDEFKRLAPALVARLAASEN